MKNYFFNTRDSRKEEFMRLIVPIERELYYIANSKLNNENDIEDILQETLLSAYKKKKSLKDNSNFKNWIITILINKCNDFYRKKGQVTTISYEQEDYVEEDFITENYSEVDTLIDFSFLLNHLENDERIIFTLFYSDQRTTKEIAMLLSINENTVKTKLRRTKEKLKIIVERGIENEK